ncbi:MAG: transglycosylase SLT domain-containing protein, partial [Gammaproteobacteria bacterium]|nr:transglycosylase SLT domain-containing protein [Gammaproteobacteria bacterium]
GFLVLLLAIFIPSAGLSKTSVILQDPLQLPLFPLSATSELPSVDTRSHVQPASTQPQVALNKTRKLFIEAERAIKKGRRTKYRKLLSQLEGYPLYPYLLYAEIKKRIHSAKPDEIEQFLTRYSDSPLAYRLRRSRLFFLARNKRWEEYLTFYQPTTNLNLRCNYHRALNHTGQLEQSFSDIENVWLHGRSLPKSCDSVLSIWKENNKLTPELVWERISLAMKTGRSKLAKHLAEYLPSGEQYLANTWYKIHHKPSLITKRKILNSKHPMASNILVHGMKRLARYNPERSVKTWEKIKTKARLTPSQKAEVYRSIGTAFQRRDMPEALTWLAKIPAEYSDQRIREWRIRITLKTEDWEGSLHWINQLTQKEQNSDRWLYWRARSLEGIGNIQEAEQIYHQIAKSRSYESFLAAERVGQPYQFSHQPLSFTDSELAPLRQTPGMLRARELLAINKLLDARREWHTLTQNMDDRSLQMAAKIANDWNWHERGILTLGQSSNRDDLEIRFPIVHKNKIFQHAISTNIEPAWALSIMRQESAFAEDARSSRNARGLMQLLPGTARAVARSLKTKLKRISDLHIADINIRLGINYLKKVAKEFNNNLSLATAAYNAGGYRVRKWLPKNGHIAPDIWIETIPFKETRNYLRKILAYTLIYEHRLGRQLTPLSQRMPQITPWIKSIAQNPGTIAAKN